jgi:hypothetical protein
MMAKPSQSSSHGPGCASRPLVYFGVLNDSFIKGLIFFVQYMGRF